MSQTGIIEGSSTLYIMRLPPGMLMCVNTAGAMRLLNRNRTAIWSYVKANRLRGFNVAGNVVYPLLDISTMLSMSESQLYNVAITYKLPLWQIHLEGG